MKFAFHKYKSLQVALVLAVFVVLASRCVSTQDAPPDLRGNAYAGAETCRTCHAAIFDSYESSAHAHTTQAPTAASIRGLFDPAHNRFVFSNEWSVVMEQHPDGFYQVAYQNGRQVASHPFDVVVGSGRKAQTYLWFDSSLVYQLPISYFVPEQTWANSPNFPADHPKFDRLVPSGCFGCHSSAVGVTESFTGLQKHEAFQKGKIIYGIDCERCHGPARAHADYQAAHPAERSAKFITAIRSLNRQQAVDLCGICHSGTKNMQQPAFTFRPGELRSDYFFAEYSNPLAEKLDVHGNQYALMQASRCYLQSQTLTCNSCHNPHVKERDNLATFSQRCQSCHRQVNHSFASAGKLPAATVAANCIDCHMPKKASEVITLLTKQQTAARPDSIRTHLIQVYREETARFLSPGKR